MSSARPLVVAINVVHISPDILYCRGTIWKYLTNDDRFEIIYGTVLHSAESVEKQGDMLIEYIRRPYTQPRTTGYTNLPTILNALDTCPKAQVITIDMKITWQRRTASMIAHAAQAPIDKRTSSCQLRSYDAVKSHAGRVIRAKGENASRKRGALSRSIQQVICNGVSN